MRSLFLLLALTLSFAGFAQQKQPPPFDHRSTKAARREASPRDSSHLAAIRAYLLKGAVYDSASEVSYFFLPPGGQPPGAPDTQYVASCANIFFAQSDKILLYLPGSHASIYGEAKPAAAATLKQVRAAGYAVGHETAIDVYEVATTAPVADAARLRQLISKAGTVTYAYWGWLESCVQWNDPQAVNAWGGGGGQFWLSDVDAVAAFGNSDWISHDIDSVDNWSYMHVPSTAATPNIVLNIIDGGLVPTNPDFFGNIIYAWDYGIGNPGTGAYGNSADPHGMAVTGLAAARANNNYGGVGIAHDFPIRSHDVGGGGAFYVNAVHITMDSLFNATSDNPSQKNVVNMSFSAGNDAILYSKITATRNLQSGKQTIFCAATGNAGVSSISWPARWSGSATNIFAVGGVRANDTAKGLWSGSNRGGQLSFVADGQLVHVMYDTAGSYSLINGTSLAAPILAGAVAQLWAQDTSRGYEEIFDLLKIGARDLGAPGFDTLYGWGYAQTGKSLKAAVVMHVPDTFWVATTPTYSFTPKYYNKLALHRKCFYPNGTDTATFALNPDSTGSFNLAFTPAHGFVMNGWNTLHYQFQSLNGCITDIYKRIYLVCPTTALTATQTHSNPLTVCAGDTLSWSLHTNASGSLTVQLIDSATNAVLQTTTTTDTTLQWVAATPQSGHALRLQIAPDSGCYVPASLVVPAGAYTVAPVSAPLVTVSANPGTSVASGTAVTFTANFTSGGASPAIRWMRNGAVLMAGVSGNTWTGSADVDFYNGDILTVWMQSNAPCLSTDTALSARLPLQVLPLAVGTAAPQDFRLYPNPAFGEVFAEGLEAGDEAVLRDMGGRAVAQFRAAGSQKVQRWALPVLAAGVYEMQFARKAGGVGWSVKLTVR